MFRRITIGVVVMLATAVAAFGVEPRQSKPRQHNDFVNVTQAEGRHVQINRKYKPHERNSELPYVRPERAARTVEAQTDAPTLCGIVLNDPETYYVASFPAEPGARLTNIYSDNRLDASGSAVYVDGTLYVQSIYTNPLGGTPTVTQYVYDARTWELLETRDGLYHYSSAVSMAYDPTTGTVFGYFMDDASSSGGQMFTFGTMNLATGENVPRRFVLEDELVMAMAVTPDGRLYGVNSGGMFVEINKETGEQTNIGHTDIHPSYLQSATVDQRTGRFYWASFSDEAQSVLYEVDVKTGRVTQVTQFVGGEEIVGLYVDPGEASAGAPDQATGLAFDFEKDNLSGNVTFTMPTKSFDGASLNGSLTAKVSLDNKMYTCEGMPGEQCAVSASVAEDGLYLVSVSVSNEAGVSVPAKLQRWIGADSPAAVRNLKLERDGDFAVLSWDPPAEGSHGGYINPDELTYTITAHNGEFFYQEGYTETALRRDFTGIVAGDVEYSVRAVYKQHAGEVAYSNVISFASVVYDVPFTLDFWDNFGLCTVVDANEDGVTWEMTFKGLQIADSWSGPQDDWLITPAFRLETGRQYQVTVVAEAKMGPLSPEVFEIRMGMEANPEGQVSLLSTETIKSFKKTEERSVTFNVDATGEYCFSIHAIADPGNELTLDEFRIEVLADMEAPAVVTELKGTPAAGGQLAATLEFTAPTQTVDGSEVAAPLTAEISREGEVIGTVENIAAGETRTYTDNNAAQGINRYSVCTLDAIGKRSEAVEVSVRVGIDVPELPTNLLLSDIGGNAIKLTWEHPAQGINGGYVDPNGLIYTIYEPTYLMPMFTDIQGTEFTIRFEDLTGQSSLALALGVENLAGKNPEALISNTVIVGEPYGLPFIERFANGHSDNGWFLNGQVVYEEDGWDIHTGSGVNGESGYTYFFGSGINNEEQRLTTPKLTLKGCENPMLHFYCESPDTQNDRLLVEIATDFNGEYTVIKEIDFANETAGQWSECEISLKEYTDAEYIHVAFHAIPAEDSFYSTICLDEVSIRDMKPYDLKTESYTIDNDELKIGQKAVVTLKMHNIGLNAVTPGQYKVSLYADDRCVATVDGVAIEPYLKGSVSMEYVPTVEDADIVKLRAEIAFDSDANLADNTLECGEVWVHKPTRPAVTDLTADVDGGNVVLSWSRPDMSGEPVMTRTDDFESYRPFNINSAGLWTIYDVDGEIINTPYYFPGWDQPVGFMVLNPGQVDRLEGKTLADTWPAHSGEQFMAAFSPMSGDNDDWLITPELSGNAQRITFYARGGRESLGRERMEICISTTDNTVQAMTPLVAEPIMVDTDVWTEFSFDVPAGTKYFGIHCTSHERESLHIDDFTYESAARPLEVEFVGYNVYCNGELVNEMPLTETSYSGNLPSGSYTVRVVYDLGESDDSNAVSVTSGIDAVDAGRMLVDVEYYDLYGRSVTKAPAGQILIFRAYYDDGTVEAGKVILKEYLR